VTELFTKTFSRDGCHYIASASSDDKDGVSIFLWKYDADAFSKRIQREESPASSRRYQFGKSTRAPTNPYFIILVILAVMNLYAMFFGIGTMV
jgi:hypothetical protein